MILLPYPELWYEKIKSCNGLNKVTGLHVDLTKELSCFRWHISCDGATKPGLTIM